MIITISNSQLSATINTLGAELISLVKNNKNYIWQVDETYWNKTSPILFPIVGRLKNDSYTYNGETYELPRHGFARNIEFSFDKRSEHQVIFELNETEETKTVYPFNFKLLMAYTLMDNELVIEYFVRNQSDEVLPFSIGAHPAFAITGNFENYSLKFNKEDSFETHHLENESFNGKTTLVETRNNSIALNYALFEKDALVFKNHKIQSVTIQEDGGNYVKVSFEGFPDLGIWTKINAPFICIEPWFGHADEVRTTQNLVEKSGIISLENKQIFQSVYSIEIF